MQKCGKYIFFIFVLIGSFIFSEAAFASFDVTKWENYRDLYVPSQAGFVKVTLPETVSSGGNDFSDIRIITQEDSIETPYFITRNATIRSRDANAMIINQTTSDGSVSLVLDTGQEGNIHTGIRIDTPLTNFRRKVSVYSASSLLPMSSSLWNKVTDKGYIFKFTDPNTSFSSGKDTVDIPANTSRYLKVVVDGGPEGPVSIASAAVFGETLIDVPSYSRDVPVNVFNNPKNRTSEITLDLGESGHITNKITLNSADRNYIRKVIIESSDSASTSWKYVGGGSISDISTPIFTGTSLTLSYPEQKTRYIRVSVVNDDNRPLSISGSAKIEGPIVSAIFEARPGETYRLYYGNPAAQKPNYDISRISAYIETNKLPSASLGSPVVNALYVPPSAPVVPFMEANRALLNVFLIITVILIGAGIGWYLHSYIKKIKYPEGDDLNDQNRS